MKRRSFIASLFALPVAIRAALSAKPDDLWKCVITPNATSISTQPITWFQTVRRTTITSLAYSDEIVRIMTNSRQEGWPWKIDRSVIMADAKKRAERKLVRQLAMRPLPLP